MPEICRFLGISILMYFNDHDPPHFHVVYNEHRAKVAMGDLATLDGWLPPRVAGLVREWGELHGRELLANWESLRTTGRFERIEPLV